MTIKTSLEKTLLGFYVIIIISSLILTMVSIYAGEEWSRNMQIVAPVLPFFVSIVVTFIIGFLYRTGKLTWGVEIQLPDGTTTHAQVWS